MGNQKIFSFAMPREQSPSAWNSIALLLIRTNSKSLINEEPVHFTHVDPASATLPRPELIFRSRKQRFSTNAQKRHWKLWQIILVL